MLKTIAHILLIISVLIFAFGGPSGFTYLFNLATGLDVQDTWYTYLGITLALAFLLYLAKRNDNHVDPKS